MMVDWLLGFAMLRWIWDEDHEPNNEGHKPTPNMPTSMMLVNHIGDQITEIEKLKDQLRWRNPKSEKPDEGTFCLVILKNQFWPNVFMYSSNDVWNIEVITHWRPIGPLPEGEQ